MSTVTFVIIGAVCFILGILTSIFVVMGSTSSSSSLVTTKNSINDCDRTPMNGDLRDIISKIVQEDLEARQKNKAEAIASTVLASSSVPSMVPTPQSTIATTTILKNEMDPLTSIYLSYDEEPGFDHWIGYGKYYHRHIGHLRTGNEAEKVKMLEIGVQSGGSTRVWKQYFGKQLNYVGIDINPNCKQFEAEQIHIEIGSQLDPVFLKSMCDKFGPFHFIVDDGGHTTEMMKTSFDALFGPACLYDGGVYVIEDTHTMKLWRNNDCFKGMLVDGKDIFGHAADLMRWQVEYWGTNPKVPHDKAKYIESITSYDSLIFFTFQSTWHPLEEVCRGHKFISYNADDKNLFACPVIKNGRSLRSLQSYMY